MSSTFTDAGGTVRFRGTVWPTVSAQKTVVARAAVLTWDTVAVTVVAAPGANQAIIPISVACNYDFGTTAYTGGFGVNLGYAGIASGAQGYAFLPDTFCAETADTFVQVPVESPATIPDGRPTAQVNGKALVMIADTGPIADGDGSFIITVTYATVELA